MLDLQSQSNFLGHFAVFLPSQCWRARFGELTAIINIGRTRRRARSKKTVLGGSVPTIFVWDCGLTVMYCTCVLVGITACGLVKKKMEWRDVLKGKKLLKLRMMIKVNNNQLLNYREICMLTFIVESSIVGTELSFFKGLKTKSH